MKNLRLLSLLAFVAILITCCNQQDEFSPTKDVMTTQKTELAKDGSTLLSENDADIAVLSQTNSDDDGDGGTYCIYWIKSVNGECGNSDFSKGNTICVNCEVPNGNECPGKEGLATKFKYIGSDGQICTGKWKKIDGHTSIYTDCGECPDGGKKGYKFVN